MAENKAALIQRIHLAFAGTVRPSSDNIIDGNPCDDMESEELYEKLKDLNWVEIPSNVARYRNGPLLYLTPDALRYFLPGYMIACISDPDEADVLWYSVIWELIPPSGTDGRHFDEESRGRFARFVSGMTREQREAVCEYVKFDYRGSDEITRELIKIEIALEFWKYLVQHS